VGANTLALRTSIKNKCFEVLGSTRFSIGDFSCDFPETKDGASKAEAIVIRFKPDRRFSFIVVDRSSGASIEMSPGKHRDQERFGISGYGDVFSFLKQWTDYIYDELVSNHPFYDEMQSIRTDLEEKINKHVEDRDAHFTRAEAEVLAEKIEALKKQFEELAAQNQLTKDELGKLKEDFEAIKKDTATFKKGVWYATAGNKLLDICGKVFGSNAGQQLAQTAVNRLLDTHSSE
jgi:hypothetical protein